MPNDAPDQLRIPPEHLPEVIEQLLPGSEQVVADAQAIIDEAQQLVQGQPISVPQWLLEGGEVEVKIFKMPVMDLSTGFLVHVEGFVPKVERIPFSAAHRGDPQDIANHIQKTLQAEMDETWKQIRASNAPNLPTENPKITKVIPIVCDLVPMQGAGDKK